MVDTGGMTRGRGRRFVAAVAVAAVAGLAACSTDAADQKVIDRLSKLDVMVVPAGATELSRTSVKGWRQHRHPHLLVGHPRLRHTADSRRGRAEFPRALRPDVASPRQRRDPS